MVSSEILELTTSLKEEDPLVKQRCKALFFRAQVLRKRTDFEECEEALKEALSICPSDQQKKAIDAEFKLLEKSKQLEEERSEKRWIKAMKKNQKKKAAEKTVSKETVVNSEEEVQAADAEVSNHATSMDADADTLDVHQETTI